ncbi:unnamed protein product [Aphanomyces euteiches]|nr:hypothetical protein Ae201684P_016014 [Aphanomyces euteiches]KAH9139765.1 hypothetical protein AeRB84_015961 [Aphanomyces euteiches]
MRLGIAAALVATSAVVVLCQADQAPPALLSRRVAPLASIPIDVERQLWPKKNQTPRPVTGPKEEKGRKIGGRVGKALVGATMGAVGGFAGAAAGAGGGPIGATAASTAGVVSGVYLGTRGGQRVGQKVGGKIGRQLDKRDARKAASGVDPSAKKPGFFSRLTDKFKGKKNTQKPKQD